MAAGSAPAPRPPVFHPGVDRLAAQFVLDAQQLVVLGDQIAAAERAGLDLAGAGGHGQVGDGGVLRFSAAVADHAGVTGLLNPGSPARATPSKLPVTKTSTQFWDSTLLIGMRGFMIL